MTFILKIIGNVYMGMQLPAVSNLILSLGQTVALIVSAILYYTNNATFMNIVIANTASPLLVYMMFYPYTFYIKFPQLKPTISSINIGAVEGRNEFGRGDVERFGRVVVLRAALLDHRACRSVEQNKFFCIK